MRSKPAHKITALLMAFLMFFSSVGFSIDFHYCQGQLKSFSLVGEATSCHETRKSCPYHPEIETDDSEKKDCCSNTTMEVEDLDVAFTMASDIELTDLSELNLKFISSFAYSFSGFSLPQEVPSSFIQSNIPISTKDIYVLLERYLL